MADEVIIGNVGGDGVASEATLAALVRAVERMGNARGQRGAGDKTQALANQAIAAGTTATTANTGSVTENTGAVNKSAAALGKFTNGLTNMAMAGIGTAMASIGAMSKELLAGNESMEAYASKIPVVGGLLGALAGYADRSVDAFRELSSVGAGFGGDISAMRRSAAEMQVPLSEFKDIIMKNSEAFALFGGTVSGGIARFKEMNKNLKDTGDFETLKALGFTVQEVNEGMGDYLSIQQNLGRTQGKSTRELAAGSAAYMLELDRLASITGKSRKEIADSMNKQSADMQMQALLNGLNADQQRELTGAMTQAKALMPGFAEALQDLADGIPQTELGQKIASLSPAIAEAAAALGRGEITQAEFMMSLKRDGGPALQAWVKSLSPATISALKMQPGFDQLLGSMGEMNKFIDSNYDPAVAAKEAADRLKAAQDREKVTAKLTQFQDAIRKVSEALQIAFLDSGLLDLFATGIGMLATLITGMADSIKAFTATFKEDPAGAILNLLGDSIKGLFSNTTVVAALVGGIAALFLGKAALGAMSSAMSSWAEKSIGKMFGGGAGPVSQAANPLAGAGRVKPSQAGKGFGEAMGNIGKGLGTGIGGILKGLAAGLKAFAKPQILLGATILGGAIVAIGAGIAGAAWILGKALPTFAEGLKSFADIDGENLLNVAKGIAGVGAALAVFGAGAVIGSVGAVISNILEALPGKSPLEKLKEFADADLNTQRITNNANAMVAYSNAMKGFSGGPAPDLFAAFKTGIINLLGGSTDILAPIKAFGDIKFNTSGIIENATAVKAYSDAMKGFSGGPAPDLFASLKDGIISLLGGSTDVLAPIKAFGEVSLDTAKIKNNSEAMVSFANAMKNVPTITGERTGGLFGAIAGFFGGDKVMPWDRLREFQAITLDTAKIKNNSEAMVSFADAMKNVPSITGERTGGLFGAIAGFFGGDKVMPWAKVLEFQAITLDTAKVKTNSEAMVAFADAMKNVPSITGERTGGLFGAIAGFFGGDQVMPWDRLREFGDAKINAEKVVKNAQALSSFGNALKAFQGGGEATSNISISDSLIKNLGRLSAISADGLVSTAAGLQSIANVTNLVPILTSLNSLDATKLVSYNTALKDLTKTLEALNKELAKENKGGLFGMGDSKANAGDLLKNISVNTSQGAGNSEQLSGIMSQVLEVLKQMKEVDDKIEKNTKGFGSDISVRDVTSM